MKKITEQEARVKFENRYPDWKLISFVEHNKPCTVQHKCGEKIDYARYAHPWSQGPFCTKCYLETKWRYNIGDIIENIEIIDRKMQIKQGERKGVVTRYYQYKCLKCGFNGSKEYYHDGKLYTEHWITEGNLTFNNQRCACCTNTIVQPGINDLATTDTSIVDYFVNKNQAKMYSRGSTFKVSIVCPNCNTEYPTKIAINRLVEKRNLCFRCGTHISYAEKLMYFILTSSKVKFDMHKIFDWSRNVYNLESDTYGYKEYDFYLPDYNIVIETHGIQHYKDVGFLNKNKRTVETEKKNDLFKKELAENHGIEYIEIDCRESNVKWIKNSIELSKLNNIINISNIDLNKCHRQALHGIQTFVIQEKRDNSDISLNELAKKYGVSKSTVSRWLNQNADICNYNRREEALKRHPKNPVYSPELKMGFESGAIAADYIGVNRHTIYSALNGYTKHAGRHPVTNERLSWIKITQDEFKKKVI